MNKHSLRIREQSWVAKVAALKMGANSVAIVIGKTIHLHNSSKESFLKDERWVRHECCHLKQFKKYGLLRFLFLYTWETIKHGYHNNKFEIEAREAECSNNEINLPIQ